MREELALVAAVAAAPTVLLDLNSAAAGGWYLAGPPSLNPPEFDRVLARTLMRDGSAIPAAAFGDRTIVLPLRVDTTRVANREQVKAARLGSLAGELNRTKPVLRWRPAGAAAYTFYRCHRGPTPVVERWDPADGILDATASILAEPFGYGAPVVAGASAVPANANPYFETDVGNWTPAGCTRVRSTSLAHEGNASMLVTPDGVTSGPHVDSEQVGDGTSIVGRGVRVTGWLRSPGTPTVGLRINLYDAAHGYLTTLLAPTAIAADTWRSEDSGDVIVTTAGAVYAQALVAYSGTPTAGQTLFADEVKIWMTGTYQVTNDPAATPWGCYVDVAAVPGDVETPALIGMSANSNNMAPVFSTRRRGTVTDIAVFLQAESATLGTDTTSGADANMSGGSRARCSFATVSAMATRLTVPYPYSGGLPRTAARGLYRLFAVIASSAAGSTYGLRMRIVSAFGGAIQMLLGDTVTHVATDTGRYVADLGVFAVPAGPDPVYSGYGAEAPVGSLDVQVQAQRLSGSGSLDFDYTAALPADAELGSIATTYLDLVLDGITDTMWTPGGFGEVTAAAVPAIPRSAGIPMLSVGGQTTRIYFLRPDGIGTGWVRGPDTKTRTAAITVAYNPRYLTWAP